MDGEANSRTGAALSRRLERIGIAAAVLDTNGRVLTANRSMAELLNAPVKSLRGGELALPAEAKRASVG